MTFLTYITIGTIILILSNIFTKASKKATMKLYDDGNYGGLLFGIILVILCYPLILIARILILISKPKPDKE